MVQNLVRHHDVKVAVRERNMLYRMRRNRNMNAAFLGLLSGRLQHPYRQIVEYDI